MNRIFVHNLWRIENSNVKAYADVTIGNAITLKGMKLVAGKNGDFVAMPTHKYEKDGEDKYADIFYPKSEEARTALLETFQKAYEAEDKYAYSDGVTNPEFTVTVSPVENSSTSLKAWVSLNIGDEYVVRNIAINETSKGLMVNFPSAKYEKDGETKYNELVVPQKVEWTDKDGNACSKDYNKIIRGMIINAYKPTLSQQINSADKAKDNPDGTEIGNPDRPFEPVVK